MSALKLIYDCLELDADSIHGLSEQEIVRIEKRLKADVKLNKTIDSNQLQLVLQLLRKYYEEFKILHNPSYDRLREILFSPEQFSVTQKSDAIVTKDDSLISEFLAAFFLEDIRSYVLMCLTNEHYNGLHSLLVNAAVLPAVVKDEISKKCLFKIEYATESIETQSSQLEKKIGVLANPYFYRCLNHLDATQFETELTELYYKNLQKLYQSDEELPVRIIYACGFFEPGQSSFSETVKAKRDWAYKRGVREILYNTPELDNRGGSYVISHIFARNEEGFVGNLKVLREFGRLVYKKYVKKK